MVRNPADKNKILWVKEDAIIEQITEALRAFAMPQDFLTDVLDYIEKTDQEEKRLNKTTSKELEAKRSQLIQKQSRVADLLIDGSLAKDIFDAKNKEIQLRRQDIENRLKEMEVPVAPKDGQQSLGGVVTTLSKSAEIFTS